MPDTEAEMPEEPFDHDNVDQAILFNAKLPVSDGSVRCLVCGSELQYLTHSHMSSHAPGSPQTVEEYKEEVAPLLGIDEKEVPVLSNDLSQKLARETRAAWNEGRYDHFRSSGRP